jgi:hypothetical protein
MALILREAGVDRLGTRAAVIEVLDEARRGLAGLAHERRDNVDADNDC